MNHLTFYRYSVLTLMFLVFLTPTIRIPGVIGVRIEDFYVVLWGIVFAILCKQKSIPNAYFPFRAFILVCFPLLIIVSTAVGSLMQLPATILDLMKFVWFIKALLIYFIVFNYIYQADGHEMERRDYVLKWFIRFGIVSSLICFQQYFDIFNLNSLYIPIIAPTQAKPLLPGYFAPRVVGMVGNPNAQGAVMAICMVCHIYLWLKGKAEYRAAFLLILCVGLIMTLSRTAFVAGLFGILAIILFYQKTISFTLLKAVGLALLILILVAGYLALRENQFLYSAIFFRFENLSQGIQEGSFAARFRGWALNIEYFLKSPVFGVGPLSRTEAFINVDNEWLLFLRAYGILGVVWLISFFLLPILRVRSSQLNIRNLKSFTIAFCCLIFLYMIPANIFTSAAMVSFVLIPLAIYDYPIRKLKIG